MPHSIRVPQVQAGSNVTIVENALGPVISATGGTGASLEEVISMLPHSPRQEIVQAGTNVTISRNAMGPVISATGGGATDTLQVQSDLPHPVFPMKVQAGTNITIVENALGPVISAGSSVGTQVNYAYTFDQVARTIASGAGSVIPLDNTIPQNTEGTEYTQIATSITPTSSSNLLEVTVTIGVVRMSAANTLIVALFRDSGANAVAATVVTPASAAQYDDTAIITYIVAAGSTSSTTFKVRIGANASCTIDMNSSSGATLGAVLSSTLVIREIKQ